MNEGKIKFENNVNERTLILLKPDALHRCLVGEIISRFEKVGFEIAAMKLLYATKDQICDHYKQLDPEIVTKILLYMAEGLPMIAMVLQGPNVVYKCRQMVGDTQPIFAAAGTIRGDFSSAAYDGYAIRNLIHASDSVETATKEIEIWFGGDDVLQSH